MINESMYRLIVRLHKRTEEGKIKWEETSEEEIFQAAFPDYTIQVFQRQTLAGREYVLQIYNQRAILVEEVTHSDIANYASNTGIPVDEAIILMQNLVTSARRIALGSEKAVDYLLEQLDKDDPHDKDRGIGGMVHFQRPELPGD